MYMNDKKMMYVVVVVGVVLLAGFWYSQRSSMREAVASGHPEWQPIMFKSGDMIDGAGPALVKQIFADNGLKVTVPYEGAWDQVQAKAKSGEVDVLVAAYKTTEREGYMVYSEPYTT